MEKIKLICPDCQTEFEYDPMDIIVVKRLEARQEAKDEEVTAYLTCPLGHTKPYKVRKDYT